MELEEVCNVSVELSGEHSNKTGKKFNAATFKMLLIAFGSYLLNKLKEFFGLRLTFVQEIYWHSVQRRMVMGQLECLVENGVIKDYISHELAVSLMSGDEAVKRCLINLCHKKNILILPEAKANLETSFTRSPERHLIDEEPDTGPVDISDCLTIKELCYNMPVVEDVHVLLKDKGGFWDQALLALKYLRSRKGGNTIRVEGSFKESFNDESVDANDDESVDANDDDTGVDDDIFFGKDVKVPGTTCEKSEAEETDGFKATVWRSKNASLYKLSQWNNRRQSRWQQFNEYIPLRVSNFQYYSVNKDRKAKLNELWKKASRWPLFTYWITFVQTVIVLFTLSVHGFAPLGYAPYTERALTQVSDLSVRVVEKNITPNIWAGSDRAALILLGANYGPCMRKYDPIQNLVNEIQRQESASGCCVRRDSSGCVQVLSSSDCPSEIGLADFVTVDNSTDLDNSRYSDRAVCGTSPRTCTSPDPSVDSRWMSASITGWPICTESVTSNTKHLSCRVTGRPCCVGVQSQCIITSQEHCDFLEGYYHGDAFLCSQVNCLKEVCGLTPFGDYPDQIQRLGLSLFLHAGIFHVILTIIFNIYILRDLEKYLGWLATASLYLGSGIGGNIVSALFVPFSAEVGPSAAMFGVISFFLIFIVYHWFFFEKAWIEMLKYSVIVLVLFLVGFLPYVDNYARIGGFLFGILFSFIHIHYIPQHSCVKELNLLKFPTRKTSIIFIPFLGKSVLLITGIILLFVLYAFSFLWFYLEGDVWNGFSYVNCVIPISVSNLCSDYRQDI